MTGWDAAQAVLEHIAANVDGINANMHLGASGFALSLEPEDAPGSGDAYKFLKLDDRDIMPSGLNVFVTFGSDAIERRFSGLLTHKRVTLYVVCYFAGATAPDGVGIADPAKLINGKRGISEAMASLLDRRDITCEFPAGDGAIYDGHITAMDYALVPKPSMGMFIPGIQITYSGVYAVQSTDIDGAAAG